MEQYWMWIALAIIALWVLGVGYFVNLMFSSKDDVEKRTVLHNLTIVYLCLIWPLSVPVTLLIAWRD